MSQTQRVVEATKRALRDRGLTYADVGRRLDLSEASVKRLFAQGHFSLERIEEVAALMGLDLAELVAMAEALEPLPRQLTLEQEHYLVERPKLLLVFYLLLNDYDLDQVIRYFVIDRPEGVLLLRELESLGLIERRLGDRARLKVSRHLSWRRDGPIRRFIDERVLREFLSGDFDGPDDVFHFVSGMASPEAMERLRHEIERLVRRFNEQAQAAPGDTGERRKGCSLMVAMRPWRFSLFTEYERPEPAGDASSTPGSIIQ
jgi:transcriptional regulator with XRE-family HTH domain